jgi:hypothetical protein
MIFLAPQSSSILKARRDYIASMSELINKRIESLDMPGSRFFQVNINSRLDKILGGLPEEIMLINDELSYYIQSCPPIGKAVNYVFSYKWFCVKCENRYDAYSLANSLRSYTCTYCNRNYANTIITSHGKKIVRPIFDHFFDKGRFPLLALSFYNLIPCCTICNSSIKHTLTFSLDTHIHPYLDQVINDFQFSYKYSPESPDGLKVIVIAPTGSKVKKTFDDMNLEVIYNSHTSDLKDLLNIRYKFSDNYLSILSSSILKGINMPKSEMYRLAFGTELSETDFHKRPLSKFKKDILTELGILS